ncbi:hypothetical protein RCO28_24775 [Streptomyces sp. LHD-70]|uniref:hypothetical protein n=1 Tax=Streptomyces sp. LHD-70 TaxID=3072140 RepID=UPI00280D6A12|nr:hypothetical protein [Streptomyces sp. LHD-70]MDQ8705684.1 hypothetical protein [Streptomyces sp. LHD-70]
MRLRSAPALGGLAAALALGPAAVPVAAHETRPRTIAPALTCEDATSTDFPVTSRLHGGPDAYRPGGRPQRFVLGLENTSDRTCGKIHPVVVLVDRDRDLRPAQVRLEFRDPDGHWHDVRFERTEQDENVGVFDGGGENGGERGGEHGFTGFSLAPGASLTVPVRLAFAADAGENEVTAQVAVVQRREDDGDWVGQSGAYLFTVGAERASDGTTGGARWPSELAETGARRGWGTVVYGVAAGVLVVGGVALVLGARRLRGRAVRR